MAYNFDRFLRYEELTTWIHTLVVEQPNLISVENYGKSFEGRNLFVVEITDRYFT